MNGPRSSTDDPPGVRDGDEVVRPRAWRRGPTGPGTRRWRRALPYLFLAAALVQPVSVLLAREDWRADLLTHFQAPALGVTALAALALARRQRRLAAIMALLALVQVEPLVRFDGPNPVAPDPDSPARLRVLMANVLEDNGDADRLIRLVRDEQPDVIGLVEVSRSWEARLAGLRRDYPHGVTAPFGAHGLALWFRDRPLGMDPPARPSPDGWPYLHATIRFAGRTTHLWLAHPASPLRRRRYEPSGFEELGGLAALVAHTEGPSVVFGDFNTTAGSPFLADFLRATGLRDSRLGFGLQPSWPTWSPYRIAIDHAFVSEELAVVDRRLGPDVGSDHRPLLFELAPAARHSATNPTTQANQSSP